MRSRSMLPIIGALAFAVACDDSTHLGDAFAPNAHSAGAVVLEQSQYTGQPGDTARIRAFVLDVKGRRFTVEDLNWNSADSSVAVVNDGRLYLVQPGETQLSVNYNGTKLTASARASSNVKISGIDVFPDALSLAVDEANQLGLFIRYSDGRSIENNLGVNWSSADPSVATVSRTGEVTAVKTGKVRIIGKRGNRADTAMVTVVASEDKKPAPTLSIAPDTGVVEVGQSFRFSTALSTGEQPPEGVTWTINDPTVASISPSGELVGKKEGRATVQAVYAGKGVKAVLRVIPAPEPVEEESPAEGSSPSDQPPTKSPPATSSPAPSGGIAKEAELPRVFLDTRYPQLSGRKIKVPSGGNLQKAIDDAQPGDEILLAAGAVYTGPFYLKPKSGNAPIVIRTDVSLPAEGTRMTPAVARQLRLAKITSSQYGPVIRTSGLASNYRLAGLEITVDPSRTDTYSIVRFGAVEAQHQRSLADIPTNLVIDRSYVHGHPKLHVRRCVDLHSKSSAVVDSYIAECHVKGADAQAIAGWNGPGPYKIVNNYLEGSGENIMFGGANPTVQGVIPSDIEIRRNHIYKPPAWRETRAWTVKNSFEIKFAKRVLIEGNVIENNWTDGQVGTAILIKSVGGFGWAETSDITFRYNIIRNVGGAFSLAARPEEPNAIPASRITIRHNVVQGVGASSIFGADAGTGRFVTLSNELSDIIIENNTSIGSTRSMLFAGTSTRSQRVQFRNNIAQGEITSGNGAAPWQDALNAHVKDWLVAGNTFITQRSGSRPTDNMYLATLLDVGLLNAAALDYRLSSSSTIIRSGTGGSTPGADLDAVTQAVRDVVLK